MENCYDRLDLVEEIINSDGGFSYSKLEEMAKNNELKTLIESNEVDKLFKEEIIKFINILETKELDYHPYLRRIMLHESEFVKIFTNCSFNKILSLYLNSEDSYRVFPLFFKEGVNHFEIDKYKDMSLEEIDELLNKHMDLKKEYNINSERELITVDNRVIELYTDYSNYDYKLSTNSINVSDSTEFFIWSEWYTYVNELALIAKYKQYNPDDYVKWVSRYNGDGYGYDVLSYDIEAKREKLIEVKSGQTNDIILKDTEYKVLEQMKNIDYCDYYIYKYYYNKEDNTIYGTVLKYDRYSEVFIDIKNPYEKYSIELIPYVDKGGFKREGAFIKPIEKKKELRKK